MTFRLIIIVISLDIRILSAMIIRVLFLRKNAQIERFFNAFNLKQLAYVAYYCWQNPLLFDFFL